MFFLISFYDSMLHDETKANILRDRYLHLQTVFVLQVYIAPVHCFLLLFCQNQSMNLLYDNKQGSSQALQCIITHGAGP